MQSVGSSHVSKSGRGVEDLSYHSCCGKRQVARRACMCQCRVIEHGARNCDKNEIGRGERIRTSGLYVPNVALYQAKLHPAGFVCRAPWCTWRFRCGAPKAERPIVANLRCMHCLAARPVHQWRAGLPRARRLGRRPGHRCCARFPPRHPVDP